MYVGNKNNCALLSQDYVFKSRLPLPFPHNVTLPHIMHILAHLGESNQLCLKAPILFFLLPSGLTA